MSDQLPISMEALESSISESIQTNREAAPPLRLFMKLTQDGDNEGSFTYGPDDNRLSQDNSFILDIEEFYHGYMLRDTAGIPQDKKMSPVLSGKVSQPSSDWELAYEGTFHGAEGREQGAVLTYGNCSRGCQMMYGKILDGIKAQLASGKQSGEYTLYPVVNFNVPAPYFRGKKRIYNPNVDITAWVNKATLELVKQGRESREAPEPAEVRELPASMENA